MTLTRPIAALSCAWTKMRLPLSMNLPRSTLLHSSPFGRWRFRVPHALPFGALALPILLAALACGPTETPSGSTEPDAAEAVDAALPQPKLDASQRRQIELLQAALAKDRQQGTDEITERYGDLGNAYHIAELLDAAADAYTNARDRAPEDVRWPYYSGLVHDARGDLEAAAASFQRTLELAPDDLPAWLRLGEVQLRLNRRPSARRSFAAALERDPASAAAHHGLARLASIARDPHAAAQHLEKALELQPEADTLHSLLAQVYSRLGDVDQAQAHLDQRGDREAHYPDPLAERLSRIKSLTAFEMIEGHAGGLVAPETQPETAALSDEDFLGFVIEQVGDVDEAPEQLARMLERGPSTSAQGSDSAWRARMHYAIGGLQAGRGSDTTAAQHFAQAVELNPGLRDARIRLANSLARLQRFDQATAQYSILFASDPADASALLKRATAQLNLGHLETAEVDLRRLIAIDPSNGIAHLRLATVLRRGGRSEAAVEELEQALAADLSDTNRLRAHRHASALLLATQSHAQARVHLEAATTLAPEDVELKRGFARLLATSPDGTVRDGVRALTLSEELFQADRSLSNAETMAMALAATGRFAEAANWQRRLIAEAARFGHMHHLPRLRAAQNRYRQRQLAHFPEPEG